MPPSRTRKNPTKTTGLRYWMIRVLEECDRVPADFAADPVHDLRVALRRCRSMADGLRALDPDCQWKGMKKAGRALFRSLGQLRDVQVMMEWIEKLHPSNQTAGVARAPLRQDQGGLSNAEQQSEHLEDAEAPESSNRDAAAHSLLKILAERENQHKHEAKSALEDFDRKRWRQWSESLPRRAARFRPGSALFKHLALEGWTEARDLHRRALRNRSQAALHSLRIGIKRFRYIVENFLPAEHKAWSGDLKEIQDLLGEIHDLDVLWNTAISCHVFADEGTRKPWHARILEQRTRRIDRYRQRMVGPDSLWNVWRAALPQGQQIQELATRRMKLWAKALDPDFSHSERVAKLALELYDGLAEGRLVRSNDGADERFSLWAAALLHDVGKAKKKKGHHKASRRLIENHGAPLGWNPKVLRRAAVVARFHCGALPSRSHKALRDLLPDEQKAVIRLAAILRLANALDARHDGRVRHAHVEQNHADQHPKRSSTCVQIAAEGYQPRSTTARTVAAERYLLETLLRRPIMITPAASPRTS